MHKPKKRRQSTPTAQISLETIIDTVMEITDLKHMDRFLEEAKDKQFKMAVSLELVAFAKDFMKRNELHKASLFASAIVNRPGDDCDPAVGCDKIRR